MRSKSPRAVWGLGAGRAKWCSGAGEGASFQKSCSRLRQSMFFTSHVCQRFFQGAAAAAAGRGSPPPPGRRGELLGRDSINALFLANYSRKRDRRGRGEDAYNLTSPPAPGPLLWDMSTKMEGPGVREEMRTARWFSTSLNPPFISLCFALL